jgi:hypothetical protein
MTDSDLRAQLAAMQDGEWPGRWQVWLVILGVAVWARA